MLLRNVCNLLVLIVLGSQNLAAQAAKLKGCSFAGNNVRFTQDDLCEASEKNESIEKTIRDIVAINGVAKKFEVIQCNGLKNCFATNLPGIKSGTLKRYIFYDHEFLYDVQKQTGNTWSWQSILAHEIAHHLNGDVLEGGSPQDELQADYFSGFVMFKLGCPSLAEAQSAMSYLQSEEGNVSHPGRARRLESIRSGWMAAKNGTNTPPKVEKKVEPTYDANDYYEKSLQLSGAGEYKQALTMIGNALLIDDTNAAYFGQKAFCLFQMGNETEAIRNYSKAGLLNPKDALYTSNIANIKNKQKLYQDAVKFANFALEMEPNRASAYGERGYAYWFLEDYKKCEADFAKMLRLKPDDSWGKEWLDKVQQKLKALEAADLQAFGVRWQTADGIDYEGMLIMKGDKGVFRVKFTDFQCKCERIVEQDMRTETLTDGFRIAGYNPRLAGSTERHANYSPDNFHVVYENGEATHLFNKDDRGVEAEIKLIVLKTDIEQTQWMIKLKWTID
ncbi:MAG: hypothetical protein RL329_929 [Bacteroidota bacterium]